MVSWSVRTDSCISMKIKDPSVSMCIFMLYSHRLSEMSSLVQVGIDLQKHSVDSDTYMLCNLGLQ